MYKFTVEMTEEELRKEKDKWFKSELEIAKRLGRRVQSLPNYYAISSSIDEMIERAINKKKEKEIEILMRMD